MELVSLQSGNGRIHYATKATLYACSYFQSKLERWNTQYTIQLDMDDDSLEVILTLLRYGPEGHCPLNNVLRTKVKKDAGYLGLPFHIIKWLEPPTKEEVIEMEKEARSFMEDCRICHQKGSMVRWRCIDCKESATEVYTLYLPYVENLRAHRCVRTGKLTYAIKELVCLVCRDGLYPVK